VFDAARATLAGLGHDEIAAVFGATAVDVYRLG
jgi:hypothetical protein